MFVFFACSFGLYGGVGPCDQIFQKLDFFYEKWFEVFLMILGISKGELELPRQKAKKNLEKRKISFFFKKMDFFF